MNKYVVNQLIRGREGNNTKVLYYDGPDAARAVVSMGDAAITENDPWYTVTGVSVRIFREDEPMLETLDVRKSLGMIQDYAKFAVESLNDEHEANVRHAVQQLTALTQQLQDHVERW